MIKSYLKIVLMFAFSVFLTSACNLAPGSYPYAERYELDVNETTLIQAIENFKKDNPQYNIPDTVEMKDGRRNAKDYWYHIYFYFPDENKVVKTWTRPADEINKTTFAFIGVHDGLGLGKWKFINKDFSRSDNDKQKEIFEARILQKVKEYLKK